MKNRRNYYRILQVQPDAPVEVIRASFRTLMRELKCHPDLGGATGDAALLNEAYEVLSNPERRSSYDRQLFARYTRKPSAADRRPLTTVFCPVCRRPVARRPQPGDCCSTCRSPLPAENPLQSSPAVQRAIDRMRKQCPIRYYASWPGTPREAQMVDFSPHGMRFVCAERLRPESVLKVTGHFFEATVEVKYVREEVREGTKVWAVGVSFLAIVFPEPTGALLSTSA
jgi:DnaJ domain